MNGTIARSAFIGAAALLAGLVLSGPALADGLPSRGKAAAPDYFDGRACTFSANVGVTTDHVFRGISLNNEDPAVLGGADLTCGRFYVGAYGGDIAGDGTRLDIYGGFRTTTGPVNWDLGLIYYAFPGTPSSADADFVELKAAASGEIWRGGTLGGTVFYAPEYAFDSGPVTTLEGTFAQAFPKVGIFSPTFSATIGHSFFSDEIGGFDPSYSYWNVGLTLGFLERFSLDLRYWDTDDGVADIPGDLADERVVGTVKYTF